MLLGVAAAGTDLPPVVEAPGMVRDDDEIAQALWTPRRAGKVGVQVPPGAEGQVDWGFRLYPFQDLSHLSRGAFRHVAPLGVLPAWESGGCPQSWSCRLSHCGSRLGST